MESNEVILILSGIVGILNAAMLVYAGWKRLKPEVKKLENETEMQEAEVARLNLQSAEISTQMLINRINELKTELEAERSARKRELAEQKEAMQTKLDAETEARRKESEYLRRRIKEAEREARDYRLWAAKLVKQVVESNKIPVPFVPISLEDSDTGMAAISATMKENQAEVSNKWEERKKEEHDKPQGNNS